MLNMMRSDLYRLVRSKGVYIGILIIFFITAASIILLAPGSMGIQNPASTVNADGSDVELQNKLINAKSLGEIRRIMKEVMVYPLDKGILGKSINLYYPLIFLVAIVIAKDFSSKAVKNTLSSTVSRKQYFASKYLFCILAGTVMILCHNIIMYFVNRIANGENFSSDFLEILKITLFQLPMMCGMIALLVGIAFVTKKTALFNAISIPFIMVFQLLRYVIMAILRTENPWIFDYELETALMKLADNPSDSYILQCGLAGAIYMAASAIIGYLAFRKAEIN